MNAEAQDAEKVNRAAVALNAGDVAEALQLLREVIANAPSDYANSSEEPDGTLVIKFWDQSSFVHYVMWQKARAADRGVRWIGNAYPRAFYYLGFIGVKLKHYADALHYLEQGHRLEPTNPKFQFEKAQALVHSGEKEKALALYEAVNEPGPFVSARDLAIAHRGRGFVLIELGRLDEAERAFHSSLQIEPGNKIALQELQYIEHLRQGGASAPPESTPTQPPSLSRCVVCGATFQKGAIVAVQGAPRGVCEQCEQKLPKN